MRSEVREQMLRLKASLVEPCEKCGGTGWLTPKEPGVPNPCDCMVSFHYLNALIEAEIPRSYWWLTLEKLLIDNDYRKFVKWYVKRLETAAENALGVIFLGANGTGKTSLQCHIGKEAVVEGYSVKYLTAQQYIESRKVEDDGLLQEYEEAKFLLLDELDKVYIKRGSTFVTKTLEDFIRRRISSGAVFIMCTNYDEATLAEVFGESTMSMLRRHLRFLAIDGSDYSQTLQDQWSEMMEESPNYFADEIMNMAWRLMEAEQEDDEREWKKATE